MPYTNEERFEQDLLEQDAGDDLEDPVEEEDVQEGSFLELMVGKR